LFAEYAGRSIKATIENGSIVLNGEAFQSPSAAAASITGSQINGWKFWKVKHPESNEIVLLDTLRTDSQRDYPSGSALSVEEYRRGFTTIKDQLSDLQRNMLRTHYKADGRPLKIKELAEEVGVKWPTANMQFGNLAKLLLQELGYKQPQEDGKDSVWLLGLVSFGNDFEMTLFPEVRQVLEDLKWFNPASAPIPEG